MKIAILTPTFNYYSGIDRVVQQQAEGYSKKGNKVTVMTLESDINPAGYDVVVLGMPKNPFMQRLYRLFFFLDLRKMNHYKKLKNYDIAVSHFYPMNWLAYLAKKKYGNKIRYIYFNHGINIMESSSNILYKLYMRLFLFFNNRTLKNIDEAFSVSRFLMNELKKESGIVSKVIHNEINKNTFNKNVRGDKIIRKHNLKNKKILLYTGRIAHHKGVHLLLKAFKLIKKETPNSKLIIVGKPTFSNYFKKLKKIADKDVVFAGVVEDEELPQYYAACDVYVTASQWEGFNLPAAEAQSCGKPVVAFDIGSHPEIVKNGILVKNNDLAAFSNAIIKILIQKK